MVAANLRNITMGDIEYPEQKEAYEKLVRFTAKYLASEGQVNGDIDSKMEIDTYVIPKKDFKGDFRKVIKALPATQDSDLKEDTYLFSRWRKHWPTYSPYDCTGQLIGMTQEVQIKDSEYMWIVLVIRHYSYDL